MMAIIMILMDVVKRVECMRGMCVITLLVHQNVLTVQETLLKVQTNNVTMGIC